MDDVNAHSLLQAEYADLSAKQSLLNEVNGYKADNSAKLEKGISEITLSDQGAANSAISEYAGLSAEAKALLAAEYSGLTAKKGIIDEVNAYKANHLEILSKDKSVAVLSDKPAVVNALADYTALSAHAKKLLTDEYAGLNSVNATLEAAGAYLSSHADIIQKTAKELVQADRQPVADALAEYGNITDGDILRLLSAAHTNLTLKSDVFTKADNFRAAQSDILGKNAFEIETSDRQSVIDALAAYASVGSGDSQRLLTAEKQKIDAFLSLIDTAAEFRTLYAGVLGITVNEATAARLPVIEEALAHYNALGREAKALLYSPTRCPPRKP